MYDEVKDNYNVCVECPEIQHELLRAVFTQSGKCSSLKHTPVQLHYSLDQRLTWLNEAAQKLNVTLPEIPKFSFQAGFTANPDTHSVLSTLPDFYQKLNTGTLCQMNIWLMPAAAADAVPADHVTPNDIILCTDSGSHPLRMAGNPIFYREKESCRELITGWIDLMILMPYLAFCQNMLLGQLNKAPFEVEARVRMLTRDDPYVVLRIPSKLESGTTGTVDLDEFPQSDLFLRIGNTDVLSQHGGKLLARKPGRTTVAVVNGEGHTLREESLEVYLINNVTSITLTSPKGDTILLGDTFSIRADCRPRNAANIAQAVWSVDPANALEDLGNGTFTARAAGKCRVTLTVGKVSRDLSVNILPLSTGLKLPSEIRFKVNAAPQTVSASVLPAGSACKEIRCSIADRSVAKWNSNTKCVVPISAGRTVFEAKAIGPDGKELFSRHCTVNILPEKDIVTAPVLPTLAIGMAAITALMILFGAPHIALAMGFCLILFAICAVVNIIPLAKHLATREDKIYAVIGIIGTIVCAVLLFLHLNPPYLFWY